MQPILEIEGVSRHFGGVVALDELGFVLGAGELCSIIGPNGYGKTTLFDVVTGALAPSAGRIRAAGADITNWPPHRVARTGICRKFQVPGIYPSLSVAENLEVPRTGASGRWRVWRLLSSPTTRSSAFASSVGAGSRSSTTATSGRDLLDSVNRGDLPGVGMTIIDGVIRTHRSRNTPPATTLPVVEGD